MKIEPNSCSLSWNIDSPSIHCGNGSKKQSVFIDNVETVKTQQCVVPSEVRLYCAETLFCTWPHALYFSLSDGRCVLLGTLANRKHGVLIGLSPTCLDELPHKMIQAASQIVNRVPNNDDEIIRNGLNTFDEKRSVVNLGYAMRLSSNGIGLSGAERANSLVQLRDVLIGPTNFCSYFSYSVH